MDNSVDNLSAIESSRGYSKAKKQQAEFGTAYHTAEGIGTKVRNIETEQKLERNTFYHTEGTKNTAGRNIFSGVACWPLKRIGLKRTTC